MASGKFDDLAIAPTRGNPVHEHGHGAGPDLRDHLADRDGSSASTCRPRPQGLRPVVRELGESGKGPDYRTICRSIAVDPDGWIGLFHRLGGHDPSLPFAGDAVEVVTGDDLKKDYFGLYDPTSPGHMGYNWRQVVWVPSTEA